MWILAYFTREGEPATGLSPLVKVRDVETGVIVISGSSMLERGDGFYGYNFSAYNPQRNYAVICDSVTLSGVERYTYASSGEYNEVLDSIESTVGVVDIRTTLLRKIQTNRLELFDGDTDNWILYDDDTTTPLLTFSVSDKNGDLIVQCPSTPSKRSGVTGLSGVQSPDIYMRKSVYDPDNDGCVTCAENISDGIYTSTASGVKRAVDLSHLPCILGTKCIDETNIADGLFVSYNATTDRLEYVYAAASGVSGTLDHGSLLGLTDPDHPAYAIYTNTATFSGILSSADTTVQKALETLDQHGPHGAGGGECCGLAGKEPIVSGTNYTDITFLSALSTDDYVITVNIVNDIDLEPSNYVYTTTDIATTGFRVRYSGDIDSNNYILHWTTSSGMCGDYYTKAEINALLGANKSGKKALSQGVVETSVSFGSSFGSDDYRLFVSLENEVDSPSSEYAITITETTVSGFKVHYSGSMDSNNYYLNWYATSSGGIAGGNYDNYSGWSFAVDGVTKDAITSSGILNFVGGDNITITRSAEDEITISGTAGGADKASGVNNDSTVSGTTVKDALETLDADKSEKSTVYTNTIVLQANGANYETINHALMEQFVQATVMFKSSTGVYQDQWINGEGVLTTVYHDTNNIRLYNDSVSGVAVGRAKIVIQK
jgi:hypothetical protein